MKKIYIIILSGIVSIYSQAQNCEINVSASATTTQCGDCVTLTAFGQNTALSVLNEDFNTGGFGPGWSGTPGAVNFNNPCSGGGVDGTPHAWMDNNTDVPRELVSAPYDFSGAAAGVSVCFDMLYAVQGGSAPCEGPDEPDEGVYLEYSTDGGVTWTTINYFDPLGGNNAQLTNWNNYCFDLPPAAITANTTIRWYQNVGSGQDYDHWGIDNVQIFVNDVTSEVSWIADPANNFAAYSYGVGVGGGDNPTPVCPSVTTTYTAQIVTGTGDVCSESITITVNPIVFNTSISATPLSICTSNNECSDITVTAEVVLDPGGPTTFGNIQPYDFNASLFGNGETVNINIQDLNMPTVNPGSIQQICIDFLDFHPTVGEQDGINDIEVSILCPDGSEIALVLLNTGPEGINGGWFGTDQPSYYQNVCFVPAAAQMVSDIPDASAAAIPVTGTYQTAEPFTGLEGCTSNGIWQLHLNSNNFFGGNGTLTGWSITFDDEPLLGPVNFTWNLPANLSNPNSLTPTTCIPGTYTIDIDNGNPACGVAQESITISGVVAGDASFTALDYCSGTVNQIAITGDAGGTFSFNPAVFDGATINPTTGIITNGVVGTTYTIEYMLAGAGGCNASTTQNVAVLSGISTFNTTDFCEGAANQPVITGDAGGTFTFNPLPNDGATIDANTGSITNGVAGTTYQIEYTSGGICSSTTINPVSVFATENASFTVTDYCFGAANQANITGDAGGTFTFNPVVADGATINAVNGSISNGVAGTTYTLEYTTAGNCPTSTTQNVTVNAMDDASFTLTDFCAGNANQANITGTTGGTFAFNPAVADGATINSNTGEISSGVSGTNYSVEYTTNGTCPLSSTQAVNVLPGENPAFTVTDYCVGAVNQATITGDAGGSFAFNPLPVDGATINSNNGTVSNGIGGTTYTIEYTTSGSCAATSTQNITVNIIPTVNAGVDQTICDGNQVTLSAQNPDNATITWDNGITDNVAFNQAIGNVTYTATANLLGCTSTDQAIVTVNPNPTFTVAGTDPTTCSGSDGTLTISGLQINTNYDVSYFNNSIQGPNNLLSNNLGEITISNLSAGSYTTFDVALNGCNTTDNTVINLVDPTAPSVNAGVDQTICEPNTVVLNANNPDGANISWSNGVIDGVAFNPPTATTIYTVTATLAGCTSTDAVSITANPLPNISANNVSAVCEGFNVLLTANNPDGANLSWDNGITNNVPFIPANTGTTTYTVTATLLGCIATSSVDVLVNPNPVIDFTATPQFGCAPLKVVFENNTNGSINCSWDYGNGDNSSICGNHEYIYENAGLFDVTLTVTNAENCSSTLTETEYIQVEEAPEAIFSTNTNFISIDDTEVEFTNSSTNATNYTWNFGDNQGGSSEENPIYSFPELGSITYTVTLIASNDIGCADTVTAPITVQEVLIFYVPNAFTPDGDEYNQTFKPIFTAGYDPYDYHLTIFNRWGEIIFESYNADIGWNGKYGTGELVEDGVYAWRINFKESMSDKKHKELGHVVVLK